MNDLRTIKRMVAVLLAIVIVVVLVVVLGAADDNVKEKQARGAYLSACIQRGENLNDPEASARGVHGTYQCGDGNQIKRNAAGHWLITTSTR